MNLDMKEVQRRLEFSRDRRRECGRAKKEINALPFVGIAYLVFEFANLLYFGSSTDPVILMHLTIGCILLYAVTALLYRLLALMTAGLFLLEAIIEGAIRENGESAEKSK